MRRRLIRENAVYTADEDDTVELAEVTPADDPGVEVQGEPWGWTKDGPRPRGWREDGEYGAE